MLEQSLFLCRDKKKQLWQTYGGPLKYLVKIRMISKIKRGFIIIFSGRSSYILRRIIWWWSHSEFPRVCFFYSEQCFVMYLCMYATHSVNLRLSILVLTIFNEGAYLTFKSIFHKALNFSSVRLWYHARIHSWNQPVLSNKGKVSCSRKQRGPLMGLEPTTSTLRVRRGILITISGSSCLV